MTVFAPLNAWMFKAMSGHNVQILSVSIFIIGNLICAIAPNFLTLAAGRVISAYGAAMFTPSATALAVELLPPARKGFALSLIFGGMTVSQVAGVASLPQAGSRMLSAGASHSVSSSLPGFSH